MQSIQIIKLTDKDLDKFMELIRLFEEVFEMENFSMPHPDYLQQQLTKSGFFVFVAMLNNKVVGGLTAYTLHQYYSTSPIVYIYDLAVKPSFQRQGIGKLLISAINTYCKELGMEEVFLEAAQADTHAIKFYRSTGAHEDQVVHFYYPLNEKKV